MDSDPQLCHISSLPVELLAEIMRMSSDVVILPFGRFPWNVASVSRHWRSIALSHPQLWNAIFIQPSPNLFSLNADITRFIPVLELVLKRAGESRLTFTMPEQLPTPQYGEILAVFCIRAEFWLYACVSVDRHIVHVLDRVRGRLNSLEDASITSFLTKGMQCKALKEAPRLTSLSIFGLPETIQLPKDQILRVELMATSNHPYDLLRLFPRVQRIDIKDSSFCLPLDGSHITLPSLQFLALSSLDLGFTFSNLTLPALNTVKLME
ncbi:hypothetical protein HGRIS_000150 [Hohenbuehelia grisea]|uniref:F-box domain-containing protein n=1 Tax=Hohenbuehelia grisea TaxID=104357 RepID=A0ABR3JS54_9AGAR